MTVEPCMQCESASGERRCAAVSSSRASHVLTVAARLCAHCDEVELVLVVVVALLVARMRGRFPESGAADRIPGFAAGPDNEIPVDRVRLAASVIGFERHDRSAR